MSETVICPTCGNVRPSEEIKPMPHAPELPGCVECRCRVMVVGRHDRKFDPREHQRALNDALAKERVA